MITLRELVKDPLIGRISTDECKLIGTALERICALASSWFFFLLVPTALRRQVLSLRMLAAALSRTPEEAKSIFAQIAEAMAKDNLREAQKKDAQ